MQRIAHGSTSPPDPPQDEAAFAPALGAAAAPAPASIPLTFLFPDLAADDKFLIPQTDNTPEHLSSLGAAMRDDDDPKFNSGIPSIYTYFAQFLNHDIAFTNVLKPDDVTDSMMLNNPHLVPWTIKDIQEKVKNKRASLLELDSVYGLMPNGQFPRRDENPEKLAIGKVSLSVLFPRPPGKSGDDHHDLMRTLPSKEKPKEDRTALIPDPRNDSHLIISQLHVAFLRAHNALVDKYNYSYDEAKRELTNRYHWLVYHDFLKTFVPEETIDKVMTDPIYEPGLGLPLEFTAGAFRFGHSMVRRGYYLNDNYPGQTLVGLFTLIVLSNGFNQPTAGVGYKQLPEHRIIQWRKFLAGGNNAARALRPQMVEPLFELLNEIDRPVPPETRLSVQDLKRGYMLRLPTGQAIAERLKIIPLTATEIRAVATEAQFDLLTKSGFLSQTPLWFYILAEAAHFKLQPGPGQGRDQLGPVGGRIVAEVLIGLLKNNPHSFLNTGWKPPGKFFLSDFLDLAGVLEPDNQ